MNRGPPAGRADGRAPECRRRFKAQTTPTVKSSSLFPAGLAALYLNLTFVTDNRVIDWSARNPNGLRPLFAFTLARVTPLKVDAITKLWANPSVLPRTLNA